ncbi:MAG: V-type ATP synthase subunit E family protein [Fervidicoccaceae archaeon]
MEGGKPEKLSSAVIERALKDYAEYINGVKKDALTMLDDGYRKIRAEALSKLNEEYSSYIDSLRSLESSLELNTRLSSQMKINEIVEKVLSASEERIFGMSEKDREKLYSSALKRVLSSSLSSSIELHVEAKDRKIFEKIVKKISEKAEEIEIKADLPEGSGGFVLVYPETGISQDFTLKRAFELMRDELMSTAKKVLFEEE